MKENRIEERIKRIIDSAPIDLLDQIKDKPALKMMKHDEITRQKKPRSFIEKLIPLAAAAILVLMIGTWQYQYLAADSEIYMDINPSIEIVTNRKSQVIDIKAGNQEGEELIDDLSFKGKDYIEVTGELLDELILSGYLGETKEFVLLSVYNKDMKKETSQLNELDMYIHEYLTDRGIDPVVLGQKIEKTNTIEDYAREFGISLSKMTFIRNLMILHPDLQVEELANMSIRDLIDLSRDLGIDLEGIIESHDWEKIPEKTIPEIDTKDREDTDDDDEEDADEENNYDEDTDEENNYNDDTDDDDGDDVDDKDTDDDEDEDEDDDDEDDDDEDDIEDDSNDDDEDDD